MFRHCSLAKNLIFVRGCTASQVFLTAFGRKALPDARLRGFFRNFVPLTIYRTSHATVRPVHFLFTPPCFPVQKNIVQLLVYEKPRPCSSSSAARHSILFGCPATPCPHLHRLRCTQLDADDAGGRRQRVRGGTSLHSVLQNTPFPKKQLHQILQTLDALGAFTGANRR